MHEASKKESKEGREGRGGGGRGEGQLVSSGEVVFLFMGRGFFSMPRVPGMIGAMSQG